MSLNTDGCLSTGSTGTLCSWAILQRVSHRCVAHLGRPGGNLEGDAGLRDLGRAACIAGEIATRKAILERAVDRRRKAMLV